VHEMKIKKKLIC